MVSMPIHAVLFDAPGVLYERPEVGIGLQTLLDHYSLKPRHPTVIRSALRAAAYDSNVGRIAPDMYYDALLRFHGVSDPRALAAGREALHFDASRLTLFPGAAATLLRLFQGGLRLGAVANSPYKAADEVAWLERLGMPSAMWTIYLTSCEVGALVPEQGLFEQAIRALNVPPSEIVAISHNPACLEVAASLGMRAIAFQSPKPPPLPISQIIHLGDLIERLDVE